MRTFRKILWRQWCVDLNRLKRASWVSRIMRVIKVTEQSRGVVHALLLYWSLEKLLTWQMLETVERSCRLILVKELYLWLLTTNQKTRMKPNELNKMGAKFIKIKARYLILLLVTKLDPKFWLDLIGFYQAGYRSPERLGTLKPKMSDMAVIQMLWLPYLRSDALR